MTDKKIRDDTNNSKLKGLVNDIEAPGRCLILSANNTGYWLIIRGTTVTGTVLAAMEFHDFLCAHYDVTSLTLKKR